MLIKIFMCHSQRKFDEIFNHLHVFNKTKAIESLVDFTILMINRLVRQQPRKWTSAKHSMYVTCISVKITRLHQHYTLHQ